MLLPSMIQPGGEEDQNEKIIVDHGKFFPLVEEDDDDDDEGKHRINRFLMFR